VLGKSAVVGHRGNRVTHEYVLDFRAHRVNQAGDFGARSEGKGGLDLVLPLNLQDIEKVKRHCAIADAHLERTGLGNGHFA